MGSEPGGSRIAALSPDSGGRRRTREGQGLGAQGGAAAGTAVRPSAFLRPPRAASRGLGSGESGARRHRVRRRGLVRGSGAQGAGVPRAVRSAAGIFSRPPNCPWLPHPRRKVWGGLGRRPMLWDRISLPRPPGRAPAPLGRRAVLESQAPEPRRSVPGWSASPAAAGAPSAARRSGWARVGGAPPGARTPLHTPTSEAAPGRSCGGRALERAAGSGPGLG